MANALMNAPFSSFLQDIQRDINRLTGADWSRSASGWVPPVDISEDEKAYYIAVDLPGMRSEDVDITAQNGMLSISGKRDWDDGNRQQTSAERWRGEFLRRFTLPEYADPDSIEAKYENGVLALYIPKKESAAPKRISVQ